MNQKFFALIILIFLITCCTKETNTNKSMQNLYKDFSYKVDPETFDLTITVDGKEKSVSGGQDKMKVADLKKSNDGISWEYPEKSVNVTIKKENNYLDITIKSTEKKGIKNEFIWPLVSDKYYSLPFGEGKYIPADDKYFSEYLDDMEIDPLESFSMSFFSASDNDTAFVYIIKNIFNNKIKFDTKNSIEFQFSHDFTSIADDPEYGFRIYVTENNPVNIAKIYKNYIVEQKKFKTLAEKAEENKNIAKLFGAVHIYLFDKTVISDEDINWTKFREYLSSDSMKHIESLIINHSENSQEVINVFEQIKNQDYVDQYQKNIISQALSQSLLLREFYDEKAFPLKGQKAEELLNKGINNLNEMEIIELNKQILSLNFPGVFKPYETWAADRNINLIKDIHSSGITRAWLGLDDWTQAYISPQMLEYAESIGFLTAPYDSYHSIHEPLKEKWNTAVFSDHTLYENATITDENGKKISGFQNVGRKLNPVLSLPAVKERVVNILDTGAKFNSWFIDCDATGEIYDDYSKNHVTAKQQDLEARMKRISYLAVDKHMVTGSEGGNDFAVPYIAFAHGIELQSFSWMDDDMSKNKESMYYMGKYYSADGGVPEKMSLEVPVKEKYKKIFLDNSYNIPLYKLVYNDSVITTYHWDWSTFKIKDEVQNRMLYEILYNVPSLYHLDKFQWAKYKDRIIKHYEVWSPFSREAVMREMTDFRVLSDDRLVQLTQYGDDIKVAANFSDKEFKYKGDVINPHSLIIYNKDKKIIYTPE